MASVQGTEALLASLEQAIEEQDGKAVASPDALNIPRELVASPDALNIPRELVASPDALNIPRELVAPPAGR